MRKITTIVLFINLLVGASYAQRNIIGEYSTIHKFSWGSGLELTLRADSTFTMSNYEMREDKYVLSKTVQGRWTTRDSVRRLVLRQIIDDSLQLKYEFPFVDPDRMLGMTCKDSLKTKEIIAKYAIDFYPMVLYKVKGYYPSGQLECELPRTTSSNIDNCPPSGYWKYYFENGNTKGEFDFTKYRDEKGIVIRKEYYENGKLKSEQQWKDNLKDGIWKEYDESGKLIKTQVYKNDKPKSEK